METLYVQLVPLLLVAFRLSGLFVFAPMLTGIAIPAKVKILLCFIMAVALFGLVRPNMPAALPGDILSLGALVLGEIVIGAVIGLLALIPVVAVQLGGVVIGQQMGLSLATVFDPSTESESEITSELLLHGAMTIFILFGGLEVLFLALAKSFTAAPVGGWGEGWTSHATSALSMVTGALGSGMELALRVSTPVLGIILIETIASGMVMKTMPQMNIMSIGFGLKVLLGFGALILALNAIDDAVGGHIMHSSKLLFAWPYTPAEAPGAASGGVTGG